MIVDGLLALLIVLVRVALSPIPVVSFPITGWGGTAGTVIHGIGAFNQVLPVEASLVVIATSGVYLFISTGYHAVMWLLRKVPFVDVS
jgi:hypothetical protein